MLGVSHLLWQTTMHWDTFVKWSPNAMWAGFLIIKPYVRPTQNWIDQIQLYICDCEHDTQRLNCQMGLLITPDSVWQTHTQLISCDKSFAELQNYCCQWKHVSEDKWRDMSDVRSFVVYLLNLGKDKPNLFSECSQIRATQKGCHLLLRVWEKQAPPLQ